MLRKLQESDVEVLYKKLNELSKEDKKLYHPHPFTKKTIRNLLNLSYDHYFVKEENNKIIGYSMLRTFGKYKIPTYGQVIWAEYRGKGYGSEILDETLEEAKKLGFITVKLKVYPHNEKAFNLYKKKGFKIIGEENGQIWMEKKLS